jgi:hypothetical protein
MHPDLREFTRRVLGVAAMSMVAVVLTAFVSLPLSLGRHPGEEPVAAQHVDRHMS